MIKNIILALTVLSLAACAFDKDNKGSDPKNLRLQEDNAKVQANFSSVAGLYTGTLKRPNGDEKVQINLSILGEPTGQKADDGTDLIRLRQAAAYFRINPVGQTLTSFAVNFIPENGALTLVNQAANIGVDDVHTVLGKISNGQLTGVVRSTTGDIGTITLNLSANESANPSNGAEEEYNNRLREQYRELSGTYVGCVKSADQSGSSYTATMILSIYEEVSGNTSIPRLTGTFHRDYDTLKGLDASLAGTYRADLRPATLNIVGKPFVTNNGYVSTFQGTIVNGEYEATFTSTRKGMEGYLYMKKGTKLPAKCSATKQQAK